MPAGIDANTQRFFTTGRVDNNTQRFFTTPPPPLHIPAPPKPPPPPTLAQVNKELTFIGNAISKENDKSNQRTANILEAMGSASKQAGEGFSTPLIIACCVGGVLVMLYITKK